jgi:ABC-type multidrug transport system permease subunit
MSRRSLYDHPLAQLTAARVREFLREPEAVFWVFVFPILLAVALGIAFRSQPGAPAPVAVERGPQAEERDRSLRESGFATSQILDTSAAQRALATGKVALVVLATDPPTYWFDPMRPESRLARLEADSVLQKAAGRVDAFRAEERILAEKGSRYVDFLLPGLLGMNLMSTGMWSVGFSIVQQRVGKLLKLFVASPMRRWHLLAAQVLARLVFLFIEAAALVLFGVWVLDVPMRGSWLGLMAICLVGAMSFVGVGLLIAARPKTIEGVSGLMNLIMFPMWIGSGVFFSVERFPDAAQPLLQALPLTALNDALRGVMLEGTSALAQSTEMAILLAWALASFGLALRFFRWQ